MEHKNDTAVNDALREFFKNVTMTNAEQRKLAAKYHLREQYVSYLHLHKMTLVS